MGRKPNDDISVMSPFARWMMTRIKERGTTLKRVSEQTEIDYSYLFKVKRSHLANYSSYRRPGYEYTVKLGEHLGDREGALVAAAYQSAQDEEVNEPPSLTYEIAPEVLERMEAAAQNNLFDEEFKRRILRSLEVEMEESRIRQGRSKEG